MTTGWRSSELAVCLVVLGGAGWLLTHGEAARGAGLLEAALYAYVGGRSAVKAIVAARTRGPTP